MELKLRFIRISDTEINLLFEAVFNLCVDLVLKEAEIKSFVCNELSH